VEGEEPEMELYGFISEYSWYEDDITPKMFKEDLANKGGGKPIRIRIHSGGGDVFAASVMKAAIVEYPGKVTVQIDGMCASAATIVAMAGDMIRMQESAYMMIHDPWTFWMGNIEELKTVLAEMKTIKEGIIDAYETRTGLARDKLSKMMTAETWMTAREAWDLGFIDEVIAGSGQKKPAGFKNVFLNYVNVPAALLAQTNEPEVKNEAAERLRAEVKLLV
jgi:ATP-dependent Clp protease protease subunit